MPSTHLSLHFHIIFSTKERRAMISDEWRSRLHAYLGGCVKTCGGIPEAVGGTADHVHLLAGLKATHRLADVVRDVKANSTRWVKSEIGAKLFSWQDNYAAFTVSHSQIAKVAAYIRGQEEHHRRTDFRAEYLEFLQKHQVEYSDEYLW